MTTGPLDPSKDPDRFDASQSEPAGPLDPSLDPDRFDASLEKGKRSHTLPELLGEGAHEDERDNLQWLYGLIGIALFLGLVTLAVHL